jgi:hypothetical protein
VFWREPIQRTPEGDFRVRMSREERELLRKLSIDLRSLLGSDPDEEDLRRLFPPAYEQDDAGEAEYRGLMRDELLEGRRRALHVLEETADRERLQEEDVHSWLGALNDLRLVLGTRLGVTEELYERDLDVGEPRASELAVYLYLTWLQEQLIEVVQAKPS